MGKLQHKPSSQRKKVLGMASAALTTSYSLMGLADRGVYFCFCVYAGLQVGCSVTFNLLMIGAGVGPAMQQTPANPTRLVSFEYPPNILNSGAQNFDIINITQTFLVSGSYVADFMRVNTHDPCAG